MKKIKLFVIIFTATVLTVIYERRLEFIDFASYNPIFLIYGSIVTPVIGFKFVQAYLYKPIQDVGFRPVISVIVPAYNEEKIIKMTANALLASDYPKNKLEIIVVDDGSIDNTFNIISRIKGIRALTMEKNKGKRFAFAFGVEKSKGDIVICVDSDTIVAKDAIRLLVQPFSDTNVFCTCGHGEVLNKGENLLTELQRGWYASSFRILKAMESNFNMVTCCSGLLAAYRKDGISAVINEWLNETFLGRQIIDSDDRRMTNLMLRLRTYALSSEGEDRTLTSVSMSKSYTKSLYQSNAIAYTVVPSTFKKFVKQQLRWGRGSFRGLLFASTFFWKRPIKQRLLFYTLVFVNYLSPLILFFNVVILPLIGHAYLALVYISGLLLIHFISAINSKQLVENISYKDVVYRTLFIGLSGIISFIYLYAWTTLWKGKKWMTR
jgi:hyaluronan synthase